jgi:3'-5' exoribonuclease
MQPIDLRNLKDKDLVSGLIYIQDYTKKTDPVSKAPLNGTMYFYGKTMGFKLWDKNLQNIFNTNDLIGSIIEVEGDVGTYNDKMELTVSKASFDHGIVDVNLFFKSVEVETLFGQFVEFVNTNLTQSALTVLLGIFQSGNLFDPFKVTWAGAKMHDAQVGGLMNHTMKMLRLAKTMVENDSRLAPYTDLLYLNIILHDIGKVNEIGEGGIYTPNSFVTHRAMGAEITVQNKAAIVAAFGETFYYNIISVQLGHHGEFADKPTSIWAYIIHLIDMLECHTTGFLDMLDNGNFKVKNGQRTVYVNNSNLVV